MKDNTTIPNVTRTDSEFSQKTATTFDADLKRAANLQEKDLSSNPFCLEGGSSLVRFCRELAIVLTRRYAEEDDATALRAKLAASLVNTLDCTPLEAQSMIDLALEIIHEKIHGRHHCSEFELSQLIAIASGALQETYEV